MLARFGRAFVVVALLLAQHAAIAHQVAHAVGAADQQSTLCDSHDLLGTVLGVAASVAPQPQLLPLSEPGFAAPAAGVREALVLSPRARDPPLIS